MTQLNGYFLIGCVCYRIQMVSVSSSTYFATFQNHLLLVMERKEEINFPHPNQMPLSEIASSVLDRLLEEVNKPLHKEKIEQQFVDPLIQYAVRRLYPYFVITGIIFILTFLLAILIVIVLFHSHNRIWNRLVSSALPISPDLV